MKKLQETAGQQMPQSLFREHYRNGVLLVLADSRLLQVDLENTVAHMDIESPKSVQHTGLQNNPLLLCLHFFSSLITRMLRCVTTSPELKKE